MPSKYGFTTPEEKHEEEMKERKKLVEEHEKNKRILLPIADRIDIKIQDIFNDYLSNCTRGHTRTFSRWGIERLTEYKCTWTVWGQEYLGDIFENGKFRENKSQDGRIYYWYVGVRVKDGNPVFIITLKDTDLMSVLAKETGLRVLSGTKEDLGWVSRGIFQKTDGWSY